MQNMELQIFIQLGAQKFADLVKELYKRKCWYYYSSRFFFNKGNPLKAVKDGTVAMTDMFIPFTSGGGKVLEYLLYLLLQHLMKMHINFIKFQNQLMKKLQKNGIKNFI